MQLGRRKENCVADPKLFLGSGSGSGRQKISDPDSGQYQAKTSKNND
jgi:hypothetical protein